MSSAASTFSQVQWYLLWQRKKIVLPFHLRADRFGSCIQQGFCRLTLPRTLKMHLCQSLWTLGLLLLRPSLILGTPAGAAVQTTSGSTTGRPSPNATNVTEYLGIPFAQPPIGDLRFAAPQTLNSGTPINGSALGFDCPNIPLPPSPFPGQSVTKSNIIKYFGGGVGAPQSEDCLTLNIWTKAQDGPEQPVLV